MGLKTTIMSILKHIKLKQVQNLHDEPSNENMMLSQHENAMRKYNRFNHGR